VTALLFVVAAAIGGWFLYNQIHNKLASTTPVPVGVYENLTEPAARTKINADGFAPVVNHHASRTTQAGLVFRQDPVAGTKEPKGHSVVVWVSSGKPKVTLPTFKDLLEGDVTKTLTKLHLKPEIHEVPSSDKAGTVEAQSPPPGAKVPEGTTVVINVSKGPAPVVVPKVTGQQIDTAVSQLQQLGFKVIPRYVDAPQPVNTVIEQSPKAGESAGKGSTISLTVSNGPKTTPVPDVQGQDVGSAVQTLQSAGFRVKITYQDVTDPNQDGIVLSLDPAGGTQQPPNSPITLTVGRNPNNDTTTTDTTTTP
jgi:serine/threonine-protein kinase